MTPLDDAPDRGRRTEDGGPPEDAELLRRYAADRSEAAFAELVRRHVGPVYAFAVRRVGGDAHLAKDVTQVVFTTLARKAASLVDRQVLGGWLCRATHFAARDVVRAERRRRARESEAQTMHDISTDTGPEIDWEKLHPVLDETMGELNDDDRDAVWLRFFEGRSFAEVGARLRLTENAARMRVERALNRLHGVLARRGVRSTAAALGLALAQQAAVAAPAGLAASVTGAALAGAVGGTIWSAAGLVAFMSTTKTTVGIALVLAIAGGGFAVREVRVARETAAAAELIRTERDDLRARLAQTDKQLAASKQRADELQTPAATSAMQTMNGRAGQGRHLASGAWSRHAVGS